MGREIWVGLVEVRQLPVLNPQIEIHGAGAFTWVTCWAENEVSFLDRVAEVMSDYGLFVVDHEDVRSYDEAEGMGIVSEELAEQAADTRMNQSYCIYGTFHTYPNDY